MSNRVKRGDTHAVTFTVRDSSKSPVDLTGSTVRLLTRLAGTTDTVVLPTSLGAAPGTVVHQLSGDLEVGIYHIEIEVTTGGMITTSPSDGWGELIVADDLG